MGEGRTILDRIGRGRPEGEGARGLGFRFSRRLEGEDATRTAGSGYDVFRNDPSKLVISTSLMFTILLTFIKLM
jgi:hypothetical protein